VLLAIAVTRADAGANAWTTGGPEGGMTRAIAASPNYANDNTVFLAAEKRGIFKSTDRGTTWHYSSTGMGNADTRWLAISPNYANDQTLFASTIGLGVYRSTNRGASWQQINTGLTTGLVWKVVLSPQFPTDRIVFAATDTLGVFRSTNGGDSWVRSSAGMTLTAVIALVVSPNFTNDGVVLAVCDGGAFRSADGGLTWSWAGFGITRTDLRHAAISPNFANDGVAFIGADRGGVFKSTDGGRTWFDPDGSAGPADISGFAVSPNYANDQTLFVTNDTYGYSKSTDGGATWRDHIPFVSWYEFTLNNDGISIALSPNYPTDGTMWCGTIGTGVFRTQNFGQSWQLVRGGYYAARTDLVVPSPGFAADHTVFSWALGGGLYGSDDGGQSWRNINSNMEQRLLFGIPGAIAFSPNHANDHTVFVSKLYPWSLARSSNDGAVWERADTGIPLNDIVYMSISPNFTSDGTIFGASASSGIFRSTNRGQQWQAVNTGLAKLTMTQVEVSPNFVNDRTVFAGSDGGGVSKSTDGGTTWQAASSGLTSLSIRDLVISPNYANDQTLFTPTSVGIFRSTNGGASWALMRTHYSIKSMAMSPQYAQDGTVYAAGSTGLLRSTDRGANWVDLSSDLGHTSVVHMSIGAESTGYTIFLATMGGGVWQYTVGGAPPAATSTATPAQSPTRTPTPTATHPPYSGPYRLNAGGGAYTDVFGRAWLADRAYTPGGFGYIGGSTYAVSAPIANTDDDTLYQTERWGLSAYRFDLPNGLYRVELLFDEIYNANPGNRIFDVKLQGAVVLSAFCPADVAGGMNKALRYVYQVDVNNGQVLIEFVARKDAPKINALSVEAITTSGTATASPTSAPSNTATATSAVQPTATASATAAGQATATKTLTPMGTATATRTLTATPSRTATATPMLPASAAYRLNAGGPQYTDVYGRVWLADRAYTPGGFGYIGGGVYAVTAPIANTEDDTLYQTERWGMSAYRFDLPNGFYRVELLFDEIYMSRAGGRVFDVKVQGATVLAGFCPLDVAGGMNKALRYTYQADVSNGQLLIEFVTRKDAPKINALNVEAIGGAATATTTATATATVPGAPSSTATSTVSAPSTPTRTPTQPSGPTPSYDIGVNSGGGTFHGQDGKLWYADQEYAAGNWGYVGGRTYSAVVPIAGTLDDALYQSERWGATMAYRFDAPPGTYQVQLKFAEVYGWKKEQRVFDVQIEGMTVLPALDIFALAGRYTAYDRTFLVQVTDGSLDITFTARVDAPKINAFRVTAVAP
jgi:photosystem II stability/assembly factor-like uncharacterized protein